MPRDDSPYYEPSSDTPRAPRFCPDCGEDFTKDRLCPNCDGAPIEEE